MSNKKSRLAAFAGAFIFTAVLITAAPQAFAQSCGDLGAGECVGPNGATFDGKVFWYFYGTGCGAGCAVASSSGALDCYHASSNNYMNASFLDTAASDAFCAFNCGTRGSCKIKKGNGLPVELLAFGIE